MEQTIKPKSHGGAAGLPDLYSLHKKHSGFYEPLCVAYADAVGVCMKRHHQHSPTLFDLDNEGSPEQRQLHWNQPTSQVLANWNNDTDAARDGAYSVAIAAVESELGLFAVARAETKSGADYYIGGPDGDIEDAYRLEVSGTEVGGNEVEYRLAQKIEQARAGASDKLAYACVVGYRVARIAIAKVEDQ